MLYAQILGRIYRVYVRDNVFLSNVLPTRYAVTVKDCVAIFVDASLVTPVEDPEPVGILPSPELMGKILLAVRSLPVRYHAVLSQCYIFAVLRETSIEVHRIVFVVVLNPTFKLGESAFPAIAGNLSISLALRERCSTFGCR
jgi:hypothetical protein